MGVGVGRSIATQTSCAWCASCRLGGEAVGRRNRALVAQKALQAGWLPWRFAQGCTRPTPLQTNPGSGPACDRASRPRMCRTRSGRRTGMVVGAGGGVVPSWQGAADGRLFAQEALRGGCSSAPSQPSSAGQRAGGLLQRFAAAAPPPQLALQTAAPQPCFDISRVPADPANPWCCC